MTILIISIWVVSGALLGIPWALRIHKRNRWELLVKELMFLMSMGAIMGPITSIVLGIDWLVFYLKKHNSFFNKVVYDPNREDNKRRK